MSRYYNVTFSAVIEADDFDAAEAFAKQVAERGSRMIHIALGGKFCGLEYLNDAEDADDGCPVGDPECLGDNGDCHDACEAPV